MTNKFRQLLVPEGYRHYWSKYPEGYTILEALLNWVDSVNQLTDNVNDWNLYLDDFVENFDEQLAPTVRDMLNEMENDGRLTEIINEHIFEELNNKVDVIGYQPTYNENEDFAVTIQELYDTLPIGSTLKVPSGTYNINTPLRFDRRIHLDFTGVEFVYTGNDSPCVQIGNEESSIQKIDVKGLSIDLEVRDWTSGIVGIRIVNIYSSNIQISSVKRCTKGIVIEGLGSGFSYNKIYLNELFNNKESFVITSSDGGWCNENIIYGGRFGWTSDTPPTVDAKHVLIDYVDYSNNSNRFYACSFESAIPGNSGSAVVINDGRINAFYDCRYEGIGNIKVSGNGNSFIRGYDLRLSKFEEYSASTNIIASGFQHLDVAQGLNLTNRESNNNKLLMTHNTVGTETSSLTASGRMELGGIELRSNMESQGYGYYKDGIRWLSTSENSIKGLYYGGGAPSVTANPGSIYLDITGGRHGVYFKTTGTNNNSGWSPMQVIIASSSAYRPSNVPTGFVYFDTQINKPIWFNGNDWVDADGTTV